MSVAELSFGAETLAAPQEAGRGALIWRRFKRHRLAVVGLWIVAALFLFSFLGPVLSPYSSTTIPTADLIRARDLDPGGSWTDRAGVTHTHVLGTDSVGRDYLTRLMEGGRVSLSLAIIVILTSMIIGMMIGATAGYFGGWVDAVIMRVVDFILTLPDLPIIMVLSVILADYVQDIPGGSVTILGIIFVGFGWVGAARLVRGMVLSLKTQEFTDAAKALGASNRSIILRHMLPNSLAPILVAATLGVGGVVVGEAALSYLGFGVKAPFPSWGNLLQNAQRDVMSSPFRVFYPGFLILLISLSFNFIGDALRDALDPRLKL